MSTIALQTTAAQLPARAKVGAGIALPLGLMNLVGVVIFWEWSWMTWVGFVGIAMAAATILGSVGTLRGRADGAALLRRAMLAQMAFTVMKLVGWQELEALTFGAVATLVYALARERR